MTPVPPHPSYPFHHHHLPITSAPPLPSSSHVHPHPVHHHHGIVSTLSSSPPPPVLHSHPYHPHNNNNNNNTVPPPSSSHIPLSTSYNKLNSNNNNAVPHIPSPLPPAGAAAVGREQQQQHQQRYHIMSPSNLYPISTTTTTPPRANRTTDATSYYHHHCPSEHIALHHENNASCTTHGRQPVNRSVSNACDPTPPQSHSHHPSHHHLPRPTTHQHQQHGDICHRSPTPIPLLLPSSSSSALTPTSSPVNRTVSPTMTSATTMTTTTTTSSHLAATGACGSASKVKVCGWCGTSSTSQWRVGPTTGSIEMATLCNACGINYRRALGKTTQDQLDLDLLAQQTGRGRLSIQKALKRIRKQSSAASNVGLYMQQQMRRQQQQQQHGGGRHAYASQLPVLTPTAGGAGINSGGAGMGMMIGTTTNVFQPVHQQQHNRQEYVADLHHKNNAIGAYASRSPATTTGTVGYPHAQALLHGHRHEHGQIQAPPPPQRRDKMAVTALLLQDCATGDKPGLLHQGSVIPHGHTPRPAMSMSTPTDRSKSTSSSMRRYTQAYGHNNGTAILTPAVRKAAPYSVTERGQGAVVKRQRGKIDVASLLDDSSAAAGVGCTTPTSTSLGVGDDEDDDDDVEEDDRALPMSTWLSVSSSAAASGMDQRGSVKKAREANDNGKMVSKSSNGGGGGKYLPSPPMSRVSSNGSSALCARENGKERQKERDRGGHGGGEDYKQKCGDGFNMSRTVTR